MAAQPTGMTTQRKVLESAWVAVPVLTCGVLAFVGFVYAWARARTRPFAIATVVSVVVTAVIWTAIMTGTEPEVVAPDGTRTPGSTSDAAVVIVLICWLGLFAYSLALLPAYLRAIESRRSVAPLPGFAPAAQATSPSGPTAPIGGGTRERLDALSAQVRRGSLPADIVGALDGIFGRLQGVLARSTNTEDLYVVDRIVTDYVPTSLNAYASLPTDYARSHVGPSGRTPHDELLRQLSLLEGRVREISDAVHAGDAARLEAQGRFLEDRFRRSELDLG